MDQPAASLTPQDAVAGMLAALRLMAERFIENFGAPSAMATGQRIYFKDRERVLRWLHDMESVVRRLLLLMAGLMPAPARRAIALRDDPVAGGRRPKEGDAVELFGPHTDSDQWRVHFLMPAPPEPAWARAQGADPFFTTRRPCDRAPRKPGKIYYEIGDPRPLAERFEALLRVIADPEHYAAKLAQRLHHWRGRQERRRIFLSKLSATTPCADEAKLGDAHWSLIGAARPMILALLPVFSDPPAVAPIAPAITESG